MKQTKTVKHLYNHAYARSLINLIERHDRIGLAKAITLVENEGPGYEILLDYAYKKKVEHALIVGITGPGGVGKSTLIDKLITEYRSQDKIVGVIAVDPSSPYNEGAFLGDRVRMGGHNNDDCVFIRSFGSRGSQGGISEGVKNVLYLYKAFGFNVILVESLGIGQDETEITMFVDVSVLVMVPGLGDIIQMSKAGVREAADIFIINKSDKPEAVVVKETLENSLDTIPPEKRPPIICTVAREGIGILEMMAAIEMKDKKLKKFKAIKFRQRIHAEISSSTTNLVKNLFEAPINEFTERVILGELSPFEASSQIAKHIKYVKY